MFTSLCEFATQYNRAYPFPPGFSPVHLVKPPCTIDLEFFHPHHLDLPPGNSRGPILTTMKEIPSTPPCPMCLLPKTSDHINCVNGLSGPARLWESSQTLVWAVTGISFIQSVCGRYHNHPKAALPLEEESREECTFPL
ncbi:hypothetical protein DSO57_1006470 [Entomophthora muscae]|uniref:Uncharacterized protein n=1 Tax=Entomophthora muscae TaxID=34485 RepID=A0ACC2UUP7_9FUNG|nr:hypothetical protein DSO57_1006470 [Entomophthora muscae]